MNSSRPLTCTSVYVRSEYRLASRGTLLIKVGWWRWSLTSCGFGLVRSVHDQAGHSGEREHGGRGVASSRLHAHGQKEEGVKRGVKARHSGGRDVRHPAHRWIISVRSDWRGGSKVYFSTTNNRFQKIQICTDFIWYLQILSSSVFIHASWMFDGEYRGDRGAAQTEALRPSCWAPQPLK